MQAMTKEQAVKYLKGDGVRCPFCESSRLKRRRYTVIIDERAYKRVVCKDCRRKWYDGYTLNSVWDSQDGTDFMYDDGKAD